MLVGVAALCIFFAPFLLPDPPPFAFLRGGKVTELTVWWSNDKPSLTRYCLEEDTDSVLARARPELTGLGFKELEYGKTTPFEHSAQILVEIIPDWTGKRTYVEVIRPRKLWDHVRDFKFQFLKKNTRVPE